MDTRDMRRPTAPGGATNARCGIVLLLLCAVPPAVAAQPQARQDGARRVLAAIYDGVQGDVVGDVNADGMATSADLTGTVEGLGNPTWPGPYRVGSIQLRFVKLSETTGEPRILDTVIWYPTNAEGLPDNSGGIPGAPIAAAELPYPLLMFSHGSCGLPLQSLFLTPHIASYGFVVAAPPHPGNQLSDFPACGTAAAQVDSFLNRLADIEFVITELLAENTGPSSPLFGAIDPEKIGMSGHSFGGQTTLRVAKDDPRVIAGLALAPALIGIQTIVPRIRIPMMIQGGEIDSVTPFAENQQAAFDSLGPPRYLVEIGNTGHFAFSDLCFPSPDCLPEHLRQDEAHTYVLRFALPFLLSRVAGNEVFDAFLDARATPPGVRLDADPGI